MDLLDVLWRSDAEVHDKVAPSMFSLAESGGLDRKMG